MTAPRAPRGLGTKGQRLWKELHEIAEFNPAEIVLLEEACRISDRLDKLHFQLDDPDASWLKLKVNDDTTEVTVIVDNVLGEARQQANVLKQIVAALRIPDEKTGAKPQRRGGARGSYKPSGKAASGMATVTALNRAAQRGKGA